MIATVSTAESQLGDFNSRRDFQGRLLAIFAALALVLAATGIFGVVHYAVAERTREVGVRVALGATPGAVVALIVRDGMRSPILGVAIGLAAALGSTRLLASLLYGVGPTDPVTFTAASAVLVGVAALACVLPAHRAARIDPVSALRRE